MARSITLIRTRPKWLAVALCAAAAVSAPGCGSKAKELDFKSPEAAGVTAPPTPKVPAKGKLNRFDTPKAWDLIKAQVRYGQRPAGSRALKKLAEVLRPKLPGGHFEPVPGQPGLRNIVGSLPGTQPAIVIGAHYDTLAAPPGFKGANNGASGSAIVIQLAHDLAKLKRPAGAPALQFALFDGEEPPKVLPEDATDFYSVGLRGSKAYVKAHRSQTRALVLLDYVAGTGLRLPREASSTRSLWRKIQAAARAAGFSSVFPAGPGPLIVDDHTPFLRAHIPAVDLIDWSYPGHSIQDGLALMSKNSVEAVGETIFEYVRRTSRAP
jgi:hypothetical protein